VYACALIFFPLLRYCDELSFCYIYPTFVRACASMRFSFAQIPWWSEASAHWTCICSCMRMMLFCAWNRFHSAQIPWWAGAGATMTGPTFVCTCAWCFLRMKPSSLCSDSVFGWSCWCYGDRTHICLRMRIDAFSLCSDTVMVWS
jgi:hypothetical protein